MTCARRRGAVYEILGQAGPLDAHPERARAAAAVAAWTSDRPAAVQLVCARALTADPPNADDAGEWDAAFHPARK